MKLARYYTLRQVAEESPAFTVRQLRYMVQTTPYGFERCVCRPSPNRVLIDMDKFERWLEARTGKARPSDVRPPLSEAC